MTKLYIANCKPQDEEFLYRVAEKQRTHPFRQVILAGQQLLIYKEESEAVLRGIIQQHEKYGLVHVSDIDRTKPFISLCWQFDKPITPDQIAYSLQHNHDVLEQDGQIRRDQAAVGIADNLGRVVATQAGGRAPGALSLEIEERKPRGDQSKEGINEVIRVDPTGGKAGAKRKKGRIA